MAAAAAEAEAAAEEEAEVAEERAREEGEGEGEEDVAPLAAVPLSEANFDTGRPAVPESTLGGESTCIICFTPQPKVARHGCLAGTAALAPTAPPRSWSVTVGARTVARR